jgi:pyridoxal/pyridoxine/pyridoxamine kinase
VSRAPWSYIQLADLTLSYVGNKMASFVMQSLGCDVSAINTVHYSKRASVETLLSE